MKNYFPRQIEDGEKGELHEKKKESVRKESERMKGEKM